MRVKYFALAIAALLVAGSGMAQKKGGKTAAQPYNGGITTEMMQQMKQSYGGSATDKALRNIMVTNSPAKLAMPRHSTPTSPTAWRARPSQTRSRVAVAGCSQA